MTFADKVNIVKTLSLHYLIYGNQADIDQLMDGFETLGILQLMQKPILQSTNITTDVEAVWSPNGSNQCEKEELIIKLDILPGRDTKHVPVLFI